MCGDFRKQPALCLHTYPSLLRSGRIPRILSFLEQCSWKSEQDYCFQAWLQFLLGLIQFAASPAGTPCSEVRRGILWRINSRCWERPNLWPWGKTHKLETTKPPRKFIRTSGHLIRDLIKVSKVDPSPVFTKIVCPWTIYAKDYSSSFSPASLYSSLPPSLAFTAAKLILR